MLFELCGLAKVINIQPVSQGFTKVQVLGAESRTNKGETFKLSGARWINLNGQLADHWANNQEQFKNTIVHLTASASTDNHKGAFFENYRCQNLSVALWKENAPHINPKLMTLSGVGFVIDISKKTDSFTTLKVISSKRFGDKEVVVTRFIGLSGNAARWWAERADTLLKTRIMFKAEVTSSKVGEGENAKFYDNYTMRDFPEIISFPKKEEQNHQHQQQQQQYFDDHGFPIGGYDMDRDIHDEHLAYQEYEALKQQELAH